MKSTSFPICWLGVVLLLRFGVSVSATLGTPEQTLRHDLLENYTVGVRPVLNPEDVLNVSFSYKLSKVVALDIKAQVLTTDAWIVQTWKNPYLSWNESKYRNIHTLHLFPSEIWVPDTVLYNNADEDVTLSGFTEKFKTLVIVESTGLNKWMSPATFKSSCDMKVKYYPFDIQKCKLTFGSWTYDTRLLKVTNAEGELLKTEKYTKSGDWHLIDVVIDNVEKKYACCDHPFSDVTYTFNFERRRLYHVMYNILPCVPIVILVLLNFLIPPESGERIGFGVTILLALGVFQLILANSLPETSDDIAILGLYYILTMVLILLSLIETTVVLRCHFGEGKPPNSLVKFSRFILRRKGKESIATNKVLAAGQNTAKPQDSAMEMTEISKNEFSLDDPPLSVISQSIKEQREQNQCKGMWKEIAEAVDRCLLVMFILLSLVISLSVWFQEPDDGEV